MCVVSQTLIPYSKPFWTGEEVAAVTDVIQSGWWTTGPKVQQFENALASKLGASGAVCVSNGTMALWAVLHLLKPPSSRPLYVTSALNFVAGPACANMLGYEVAFADIHPDTLNLDPRSLEQVLLKIRPHHSEIIINPVHFSGIPVDMDRIASIASQYGALLVEDSCHALHSTFPDGRKTGNHAASKAGVFSFHPTKNLATGEGGAIVSDDDQWLQRVRLYCNHNMRRSNFMRPELAYDHRGEQNSWYYEVQEPGLNLRMSELSAVLGLCQLKRLDASLARRAELAQQYRDAMVDLEEVIIYPMDQHVSTALHLFVVGLDLVRLGRSRAEVFDFFFHRGIQLQVHYTPLHWQPAFAGLPFVRGSRFPHVDRIAPTLVSLPLYYGLTDEEQNRVVAALRQLCGRSA